MNISAAVVLNMCTYNITNAVRVKNMADIVDHCTAKHVIILYDKKTTFARIVRIRKAMRGICLSSKVVDAGFTDQHLIQFAE